MESANGPAQTGAEKLPLTVDPSSNVRSIVPVIIVSVLVVMVTVALVASLDAATLVSSTTVPDAHGVTIDAYFTSVLVTVPGMSPSRP